MKKQIWEFCRVVERFDALTIYAESKEKIMEKANYILNHLTDDEAEYFDYACVYGYEIEIPEDYEYVDIDVLMNDLKNGNIKTDCFDKVYGLKNDYIIESINLK